MSNQLKSKKRKPQREYHVWVLTEVPEYGTNHNEYFVNARSKTEAKSKALAIHKRSNRITYKVEVDHVPNGDIN